MRRHHETGEAESPAGLRPSKPLAIVVASLSIGTLFAGAVLSGCNTQFGNNGNLCGWIADPDNCYRRFAEGMQVEGTATDLTAPKCGRPSPGRLDKFASDDPDKPQPTGAFVARDKLDVCIGKAGIGGQVVFDPPLDPTAFPPTNFNFKIIDSVGQECGSGSFGDVVTYSITVKDNVAPSGAGGGGTGGQGTGGADSAGPIFTGTFSSARDVEKEEVVTVSCPTSEVYKFNLFQMNQCPQYRDILPAAEVESNPGAPGDGAEIPGIPGFVRLRLFYPPVSGVDESAQEPLANKKPVEVEYFYCEFPPPLPPCFNGEKDGSETDVDCGGVLCNPCVSQQTCISNSDCISDCVCEPDAMGLKRCCGSMPPM